MMASSDVMMASSVVSERRSPAAAAGTTPDSDFVSSTSPASSHSDAGVVRDTCFVNPAVSNARQVSTVCAA